MKLQAQPYRKGARQPGAPLTAMLKGRTSAGMNPQDTVRATAKGSGVQTLMRASKRARRPERAKRPDRAPR